MATKYIVRIGNTDLDGKKDLSIALTKIKGISKMYSNAVCHVAGIQSNKKAGEMTDAEVSRVDEIIKNPIRNGIPDWLFNRKSDPETGEDRHIIGADMTFIQSNDIKQQKKIKSYRGMRHAFGLTCRGQRTRSNFRRNKSRGKSGSLGVARKKGKK